MGLEERENKRKKSLIGSMISDDTSSTESENQAIIINEGESIDYRDIVIPKEKEETRSKRLNLLLKPSTYTKAQKKCEKLGISLNECINQFLDNWVQ